MCLMLDWQLYRFNFMPIADLPFFAVFIFLTCSHCLLYRASACASSRTSVICGRMCVCVGGGGGGEEGFVQCMP